MDYVDMLAEKIKLHLDLRHPLSPEYYYGHLACCVMDAVHSIGVRYEATRQVPIRYCEAHSVRRLRPYGAGFPVQSDQERLSTLVSRIEDIGHERFAIEVVKNRHRTSPVQGILKTEAVLRFAKCLTSQGIETFQDLARYRKDAGLEASIKAIPGQTSGIGWRYFWMLAGDEQEVKPDRMILTFLNTFSNRVWQPDEAVEVVRQLCAHASLKEYELTPRRLDHAIWNWQRAPAQALSRQRLPA